MERACRNANFMPDFGYLTFLSILSEIKFGNFVPLSRVFRDLKRQNLATCLFVPHLVGVTGLSDNATVFDRSSEILANFAKFNQATKSSALRR